MGRLIDADKLDNTLFEEIPLAENVHIFHDMIENQQTAYDIVKVVEELEHLVVYEVLDGLMTGEWIKKEQVLKIVKEGGKNER